MKVVMETPMKRPLEHNRVVKREKISSCQEELIF